MTIIAKREVYTAIRQENLVEKLNPPTTPVHATATPLHYPSGTCEWLCVVGWYIHDVEQWAVIVEKNSIDIAPNRIRYVCYTRCSWPVHAVPRIGLNDR